MGSSDAGGPRISSQGGRHVIFISFNDAGALRIYLQTKGVTCTHPQAVTDEMSSVEVSSRYDLVKVQAMLDDWSGRPVRATDVRHR